MNYANTCTPVMGAFQIYPTLAPNLAHAYVWSNGGGYGHNTRLAARAITTRIWGSWGCRLPDQNTALSGLSVDAFEDHEILAAAWVNSSGALMAAIHRAPMKYVGMAARAGRAIRR